MKISGWAIVVSFLLLGLIPLAWVYFQVVTPYKVATDNMKAYNDLLTTEKNKQKRAEQKVDDAWALLQQKAGEWKAVTAGRTPASDFKHGGVNIYENQYQLVVDTPRFRDNAQRAFNAQLHAGGVKVVGTAPEIPASDDSAKDILANYYNFPAFSFPVVLWELGNVTVTGTYSQIMANVRSWSNMPHYLAVVDGLRIDGTSPTLTGSYNVTLVGYIPANNIFPSPPADAAGAGAASSSSTSTSGGGGGGPQMGKKGGHG